MATTAVGKDVTLEEVLLHLKALEERVAALERITGQVSQSSADSGQADTGLTEIPASPLKSDFSFTSGNFASVAKALLGFAGAYLLRAVAESGSVAQSIGILAGLMYSGFWLFWAVRGGSDSFSATLFALTSACILGGLVWENAVQTHVLALWLAALLITFFTYIGMFLASRRALPRMAAIVAATSSTLALALLLATHDVIPLTLAALSIATASEFAACSGRWLRQRWFPALVADLAVLIVTWVITQPQGIPESYRPFAMSTVVGLQITLVLIYMLGTAYRTLATGSDVTHFEIVQNMAGIALFIWGSVVMGREAPAARLLVATFCVLAGLACYAIAVLFLARQSRQRNFLMYGIFGLSLEMAGISIFFSGSSLVLVWCTLAGVVSWLGTHEHRISLQLHAPVLLGAAAVGSGLVGFARDALHNAAAPDPSRLFEIVAVALALGFCYWMAGSGENSKARIPAFLIAALFCWAILGLGGAGITTLLGPGSTMSSTLRTGLICALALGLAKPGTRRPELIWLVYPLMLYGAYRLLAEDFTHSQTTALALSLLFYGGTLLQLTRMIREDKTAN